MSNPDRVLVLAPIDGKVAKNSIGNTDPRLFNGENKVHVLKEDNTNFWYFRYEMGGIPEPLKCKFTSFKLALDHARDYYARRNVEIKEVIY